MPVKFGIKNSKSDWGFYEIQWLDWLEVIIEQKETQELHVVPGLRRAGKRVKPAMEYNVVTLRYPLAVLRDD